MPIQPTYPGVYIEEIPSGVRTIIGVATSIAAFVGRTARGAVQEPRTITSYADFDAGEAKGVLISSLGEITTGYATKRHDIPVAFVRSSIEGPGGAVTAACCCSFSSLA